MPKWFFCGVICLLLAGAAFSAGCTGTRQAGKNATVPTTTIAPQRMTTSGLADLVKDAATFAQSAGEQAALAEFSKKEGKFSQGDVYVYACGNNGTLLAHPYQPELVGENRENFTDIRGLPVIRMSGYTASHGGGFIAYLYPAPSGGIINESAPATYLPKIGYVYPAGTDWWISSGIYFNNLAGADPVPEPVAGMIGLVKDGAEYGRKNGKHAAFAEISNRSGMFVDSEGHYIYAYDYNGTLLAHPYLPGMVGTSLIGRKDAFGMENIRALSDTAREGGGYVVFIWPNPDAGNREELKIGYVLPVDDTWWVGSGVYLNEITGEHTFYPAHPA
jgi:two-component system NarL family sensor kinase